MESKRKQKDLDDILDAALDELDSDDESTPSAQHSNSNNDELGDGSTNVTAVAKGISDNAVKPAIMAPMPKAPLKRCIENLLVDIIFIGLLFMINGRIIMNPKKHLKKAI